MVDISELSAGLSVLCGGERDDKAEAAFALFVTTAAARAIIACAARAIAHTRAGHHVPKLGANAVYTAARARI